MWSINYHLVEEAGAGLSVKPIGFLIIDSKDKTCTRFLPVDNISTIDKIVDYLPNLFEKLFNKGKSNKNAEDKAKQENMEENIKKEFFEKEIPVESDGEDI